MNQTLETIKKAFDKSKRCILAFSGGSDSMVLLDILYRKAEKHVDLVFCDSGMEYQETLPFVQDVASKYGARLFISRPKRLPLEQFHKQGWPMMGKMPSAMWMQKHRGKRSFGFKLNATACCQSLKAIPTRKFISGAGYGLQFTGTRGGEDDRLRGSRAHWDGILYFEKASKLLICNPLSGWTNMMIRRYTAEHNLPIHPLKRKGMVTTGCMFCGGGAQFSDSGYRILRKLNPEAWHRFFVEWKAGEILLAIKYDVPLKVILTAIENFGGLDMLAKTRPWLFDYIRPVPLQGRYDR